MFESVLCTSFHAARDCGRLLNFTFRPTHTNIDVWPRDNWPAVTQEADRQKICYHASLTSSEIDSDTHKIFSQYVCMSLPGAPIVLQPTLDFKDGGWTCVCRYRWKTTSISQENTLNYMKKYDGWIKLLNPKTPRNSIFTPADLTQKCVLFFFHCCSRRCSAELLQFHLKSCCSARREDGYRRGFSSVFFTIFSSHGG